MTQLLIRNARLLAVSPEGRSLRGGEMQQVLDLPAADVWIDAGHVRRIDRVGERGDVASTTIPPPGTPVIDARHRVLMPAFVDCHTHLCWSGSRHAEWQDRLRGTSYLDILRTGGGILATVRAVRNSSLQALAEELGQRLRTLLRHGTTAVEIKSGYGLDTANELKMLNAITMAAHGWPGRVALTACLGHAVDPEVDRTRFVERTIGETLPAVSAAFPGIAVDAYCESGAWSLQECRRLFDAAQAAGHPVRVHADQFQASGMVDAAVERNYLSVDHLEASDGVSLDRLARSNVWAVLLPCSSFHLDGRYANGRRLLDMGARVALATNANPGSAPCVSMPMTIALACRRCGMEVSEAIAACTINAAQLLGWSDLGWIGEGSRADLVLLRHQDPVELAHEFGGNPADVVICGGQLVASSAGDMPSTCRA